MIKEELVKASYGATAYSLLYSDSGSYYQSKDYLDFLKMILVGAAEFGIDIKATHKALGLFEGRKEPSSAIEAKGTRESLENLARQICSDFEQKMVRIIYQPGHGQHKFYSFSVETFSNDTVMHILTNLGIDGARIVNHNLELADVYDLSPKILNSLEKEFGSATIFPCEVTKIVAEPNSMN